MTVPTYMKAPAEVHSQVQTIIDVEAEFKDLKEAELIFQVIQAYPKLVDGEPVGAALTHNGYAAAALIKINSYKDRVRGLPDVTIFIDGDKYGTWPERRQEAVFHHELTHLVVQRLDDGSIKPDDAGRPKLKMRIHDFQIGVFAATAKKYGNDALDTEQLLDMAQWVQLELFPRG